MKSFKQFIAEQGTEPNYDGMRNLVKKMLPLDREQEGRDKILKKIDGWEKNLQENNHGS